MSKKEQTKRDAMGICLGESLLHARDEMWFPRSEATDDAALWPIVFMSKSLMSPKTCYRNTERETLGIPHGLEKLNHYHFNPEVSKITDYKALIVIFKKDVGSFPHRLQ